MSNTSYYKEPEFQRILQRYEKAHAAGQSVYLDAEDFADIAEYYLSQERLDDSDQCIAYALTLHPRHTRLLVLLAKKYIDEGNIEQALSVEQGITDREDYSVKLLHGEILLYNFEFEKADSYLNASFPDDGQQDYVDDVLDVAALLLDYEQPERASSWLDRLGGEASDLSYFHYLRSLCFFQLKRFPDSIAAANKCLDLDPYDVACWGLLADAQYAVGDYRKSVDSCDYALAVSPDDAMSLSIKAKSLYKLHEYAAAHDVVTAYLKVRDGEVEIYLLDGICLLSLGKAEEALARLKKAGSLCPSSATDYLKNIFFYMSQAYLRMGEKDEASSCMEQAVRLGADDSMLRLQQVENAFEAGQDTEALRIMQALYEDKGQGVRMRLHLLLILVDYGYQTLAYDLLAELKDDPDARKEGFFAHAAYVCYHNGHNGEYLDYLQRACSETPDIAYMIFNSIFPDVPVDKYVEEARRKLGIA